ncbi:MAG: peptidoglycan peptidase [Proteobacteria bacterium]|nr:peptidoglycan peptidase [Pseudomonadota bacterium]
MKRALLAAIAALFCYAAYLATLGVEDLPPLHDGDIVFQSSWTGLPSLAIGFASTSWYIHTGIVHVNENGETIVIEAARQVSEIPLREWVERGILRRFSAYRYNGLTPEQGKSIVAAARKYMGLPYDHYFSFGKDAIYCSELEYYAFNESGVPLAQPEKIGSLNINNRFVKQLIEQRWQNYPACKGQDISFEECYARIMDGELITPASIARDTRLTLIFNNYPF